MSVSLPIQPPSALNPFKIVKTIKTAVRPVNEIYQTVSFYFVIFQIGNRMKILKSKYRMAQVPANQEALKQAVSNCLQLPTKRSKSTR